MTTAISKHKSTLKSHKLTKELIIVCVNKRSYFRYVVKLQIYMQFVDMYERTLIRMNNN